MYPCRVGVVALNSCTGSAAVHSAVSQVAQSLTPVLLQFGNELNPTSSCLHPASLTSAGQGSSCSMKQSSRAGKANTAAQLHRVVYPGWGSPYWKKPVRAL